jgi:biopolymer transport protein ExbD
MRRFLDRHGHIPITRINMTPMIDVTFLLLTFFMVTSHFASAEKVDVELPHPDQNQSVEQKLVEKVIINLEYHGEDPDPIMRIGALQMESDKELVQRLRSVAAANPNTQVILRADRRLPYGPVRDVMRMISEVNLTRFQIVTELGPRG